MEAEIGTNDLLLKGSREQLLRYLEETSGKTLRTREDVDTFLQGHSRRDPERNPTTRMLLKAKQYTWLLLLVCAFLQYHLIEVMGEAVSLQSVVFTTPPVIHDTAQSRI